MAQLKPVMQPVMPAQVVEQQPKSTDLPKVTDASLNFQVLMEPPSFERLFGTLDSEKMLEARMRQQAKQHVRRKMTCKFPYNPPLTTEKFQARAIPAGRMMAEPNFVCYNRLYFEDKNSERYGWDLGFIQPLVSTALFCKDVAFWPYQAASRPFQRSETSAGQCLPGDPVPYLIYPPDISASGGLLEGRDPRVVCYIPIISVVKQFAICHYQLAMVFVHHRQSIMANCNFGMEGFGSSPMSYRDFTWLKAKRDFGLTLDASQDLFSEAKSVSLSSVLQETLTRQSPLALVSSGEKGRSEWIIAPFLAELWVACGKQISVFSGPIFDVEPEAGLTGVCDFIVCRSPQLLFITAPVLIVAEAKRDNPAEGYGQCIAGMVAAQRFNESEKNPIDTILRRFHVGEPLEISLLARKISGSISPNTLCPRPTAFSAS